MSQSGVHRYSLLLLISQLTVCWTAPKKKLKTNKLCSGSKDFLGAKIFGVTQIRWRANFTNEVLRIPEEVISNSKMKLKKKVVEHLILMFLYELGIVCIVMKIEGKYLKIYTLRRVHFTNESIISHQHSSGKELGCSRSKRKNPSNSPLRFQRRT